MLTQISLHLIPLLFGTLLVDNSSSLSFSSIAPHFLCISFMLSLAEPLSKRFPQSTKWLEFAGSFVFLIFLKAKLSYDSNSLLTVTAISTATGWVVWCTPQESDDMTLQSFASGAFVLSIINFDLSVTDWSPMLVKPVIDYVAGGNDMVWHLLSFALGAACAIIASLPEFELKKFSDFVIFGRWFILFAVDSFSALRVCQCLHRQPSLLEIKTSFRADFQKIRKITSLLRLKRDLTLHEKST